MASPELGLERDRAFVAMGSTASDARARFEAALRVLAGEGERLVALAPARWSPYEALGGARASGAPRVLNTVLEVRSTRSPQALLELLRSVEAAEGRDRSRPATGRTLDLDLLTHGAPRTDGALCLPHPRALDRAFVLDPWEEIAPLYVVPGTGRTVVEHTAALRARQARGFRSLEGREELRLPAVAGTCCVLRTGESLRDWRSAADGVVGVVPTMGALHAGHEALLRRAHAECDSLLATLFVNPLQFGPTEDLSRYPRTFDEDLALLERSGVDAVYVPDPSDLYPPGFATYVVPEGPGCGLEGARRPGHFRGVATVVLKLWQRTRPDRAYFGRKDAQQLAVLGRMVRDLDLGGRIVACPTVREHDGLALSSRNRYLSLEERERARALPQALEAIVFAVASGGRSPLNEGREHMESAGLRVDYLEIVDPQTMTPVEAAARPLLVVGAVQIGRTRLLDNRWVAAASGGRA